MPVAMLVWYGACNPYVCQQAEALESAISILGCSRSTARLLLMHFRWDSDLLFGACLEA